MATTKQITELKDMLLQLFEKQYPKKLNKNENK